MRVYSILLTIIFNFLLFLACTNDAETKKATSHQQSEFQEKKQSEHLKEPEKSEQFLKPESGKVKEFFRTYGEDHQESRVLLETRLGSIELKLFSETPLHRANFIYNIKQALYYETIFYRVVPDFMIQGGNSDNDKTSEKREKAGSYYIPNESNEKLIHKKGSVAMAMSYDDNPDLKSAQYSYYIVIGTPFSEEALDAIEEEYAINIPPWARGIYKTVGGTPHLDKKHTVFAEVTKGMDVVEAIANEKRDSGNWPVNDVVISYKILD
ncbi:MAG: peptidylprolyl isomerase [Salibacteraceae bacterium]